jgi:spermidine synthase
LLVPIALGLVPWRWLATSALALIIMVQGGLDTLQDSRDGIRTRSYFGIYTVRDYPNSRIRTLLHGTTLHGEQSLDPAQRRTPLAYYGKGSGVAIVMRSARVLLGDKPHIGVLGLGTGTLACLSGPGQDWTFFEIDLAVLRLSRGGSFTYLKECTPQARVLLGDARLELARQPHGSFDFLAIDAFSSDSVPLHLFTHEAFGVYLDALSPSGVMMVHISNNYINLEPPLAAEIKARGLSAAMRFDNPEAGQELFASEWVAVSRDPAQIARIRSLAPQYEWRALGSPAPAVWRDDHASVLPYVTWTSFLGTELP